MSVGFLSLVGRPYSEKMYSNRRTMRTNLIAQTKTTANMIVEVSLCVLTFSVLGLADECLQNLKNIAVYKGQQNIVMNIYADTQNVSWKVIATTDGSNNRTIVDYDGTRNPELVGLYDVNQTGLIIKEATTTGTPISTAGLYIGQCANNTNMTGAMLIVVRDGPQCSFNSTSSSVQCNFTYADSSPQRLSPMVTWRLNGDVRPIAVYKNSLSSNMVDQNVFYAESTVAANSPGEYECQLSFFIDSPDDQLAYVATNEAEFTRKCNLTVEITPRSTQTGPPATTGTQSMPAEITARSPLSTQTDPPVPTATHLTTAKITTRPPLSTQAGPPVTTTTHSMTVKTTTKRPLSTQTGRPITTTTQSTTGRSSNDSLTRKPINTAAVNGSINITLECSSSYGTNATHWSFTPLGSFNNESIEISNSVSLGSFSNETILISNGSKLGLVTTNDYYELHTTANSSQLIVRLLTSLTEGTYRCNDSVESASALLLTTPFPISMEPLFGPIAGGTNITIIGSSTIIDYISRYVGSYKPNITGVRDVYIGNDLTATFMRNSSSPFDFFAVTPATSEASIGKHLPIIIGFSPTPFNITFNKAFAYRPNPNITALNPTSFIVNGGTLLDVTGHNLSSAAKPIIRVTVVITRATVNGSTINTTTTTSEICTFPTGSDDFMQCPMPPVNISVDFQMIIDSLYNSTTSRRRRRDSDLNYLFTYNSHRPHSRVKRAANVALTVNGSNGIDRVDVNLGIIFDGDMRYVNINDAFPETRFLLLSPPEIDFTNQVIEFDPSSEELIYIKGKHMQRGCRLIDYVVHVGNQICNNSNLTDNQLSCKPPREKPSSTKNDTMYCDQYLSISITLGYRYIEYRYACLTYKTRSSTFALIVGLTVGFSGLALFLTILIVCIRICRRRKGRKGRQERAEGRQIPGDREFINRCYRPDERNNERNEQDSEYDHTIIRRSEKCHSLYADNMHT